MINTPRKNGYSFKYGTLFYVPFFSCHLGISETFIRLYIYAIDFLLISSIFSNLSLKIFFIINRVLEHTKKNKKMEIEKFIKSLARKAKLGGRYSTANTYLYTLHSFQKFAGKASLTFEEITPESIKEYEQYLILNGKRYNTISLYMRMLRSICNQASEQNIASLNTRELFENVFIGNEPTAKRAISPAIISRLLEANFSKNSLRFCPRPLLAKLLPEGNPVCRPGTSPQDRCAGKHARLFPPENGTATYGNHRKLRQSDLA